MNNTATTATTHNLTVMVTYPNGWVTPNNLPFRHAFRVTTQTNTRAAAIAAFRTINGAGGTVVDVEAGHSRPMGVPTSVIEYTTAQR